MPDLEAVLRDALAPLPLGERYAAGLALLDALHATHGGEPAAYLRLLIRVAGEPLDQTVMLHTGVQRIALN